MDKKFNLIAGIISLVVSLPMLLLTTDRTLGLCMLVAGALLLVYNFNAKGLLPQIGLSLLAGGHLYQMIQYLGYGKEVPQP